MFCFFESIFGGKHHTREVDRWLFVQPACTSRTSCLPIHRMMQCMLLQIILLPKLLQYNYNAAEKGD